MALFRSVRKEMFIVEFFVDLDKKNVAVIYASSNKSLF